MVAPLEDSYLDIIQKAQRGLGLNDVELAAKAGINPATLLSLQADSRDPSALEAVASALHLDVNSLQDLAAGLWEPNPVSMPNLHQVQTTFGTMAVNAYLVFEPETDAAVLFDTGGDSAPILQTLTDHRRILKSIFLTHLHRDHIAGLEELGSLDSIPTFSSSREPHVGSIHFAYGETFAIGKLTIETRRTTGHTRGGTTYVVSGLARPVAIVGDALFAGSIGGAPQAWTEALETNRSAILSLPDETVICPGHGPMTTVAEEKAHNPLFPEYKRPQRG